VDGLVRTPGLEQALVGALDGLLQLGEGVLADRAVLRTGHVGPALALEHGDASDVGVLDLRVSDVLAGPRVDAVDHRWGLPEFVVAGDEDEVVLAVPVRPGGGALGNVGGQSGNVPAAVEQVVVGVRCARARVVGLTGHGVVARDGLRGGRRGVREAEQGGRQGERRRGDEPAA